MFRYKTYTPGQPDTEQITALYTRAFPENERRPIKTLLENTFGSGDFLVFYDDERFIGFASLLTFRDITHILYFAIDEKFRGMGYGTQALNVIRQKYPHDRIIADLEAETPQAYNLTQRKRRRNFYLRNGYRVSGVAYRWQNEDYEIFVSGKAVSADDFDAFWGHFEKIRARLEQEGRSQVW